MRYKAIPILLVLFSLSACFAPVTRHHTDAYPVRLSSFKIVDNNGRVGLKVTETGQIIQDAKIIGVIDSRGEIFDADKRLVARMKDNGILENADGENLVRINRDGTLDNGSGVLIRWLKDGRLSRGNEPLGFRLMPPDSPARQAASIVLFLYLNMGRNR